MKKNTSNPPHGTIKSALDDEFSGALSAPDEAAYSCSEIDELTTTTDIFCLRWDRSMFVDQSNVHSCATSLMVAIVRKPSLSYVARQKGKVGRRG